MDWKHTWIHLKYKYNQIDVFDRSKQDISNYNLYASKEMGRQFREEVPFGLPDVRKRVIQATNESKKAREVEALKRINKSRCSI
jgi:hypothetical protein